MPDSTKNTHLAATIAHDDADRVGPSTPTGSGTPPTTKSSDGLATPGSLSSATDGSTDLTFPDNAESTQAENADRPHAQTTTAVSPETPPLPGPNPEVIRKLFTWIRRSVAVQTHLPDSLSALVTFWIISTWFLDALTVLPCLVFTGPTHEAMLLLRVLNDFSCNPVLLPRFSEADLKAISGYRTLLISEPHLNNRTADLLGNLTNRGFLLVEQGYLVHRASPKAVYIGEDPTINRIQHSIYINVAAPPNAAPLIRHQGMRQTIDNLRSHLRQYREHNLEQVRRLEFNPRGLSLETHAIANALGSCIVDEPELHAELVALLTPHDQQQIADRADSLEALVASAALTLCHQGKDQIYVKEIAAEVNRILEARGETMQLRPEKVGHKLRKLGLRTRRLGQAGNGLTLDQVTKVRIHEVAAAYRMEDSIEEEGNLHCSLCAENKRFM
jgi:hypothetical protein